MAKKSIYDHGKAWATKQCKTSQNLITQGTLSRERMAHYFCWLGYLAGRRAEKLSARHDAKAKKSAKKTAKKGKVRR